MNSNCGCREGEGGEEVCPNGINSRTWFDATIFNIVDHLFFMSILPVMKLHFNSGPSLPLFVDLSVL